MATKKHTTKNPAPVADVSDAVAPRHGWDEETERRPRLLGYHLEALERGEAVNIPEPLYRKEKAKLEQYLECPTHVIGHGSWGNMIRIQAYVEISPAQLRRARDDMEEVA